MIEGVLQALGLTQAALPGVVLVFLRVGAMMALLPAFGEQSIPRRLRMGIALAFTAISAPAIQPALPDIAFFSPVFVFAGVAEVLVGLAIGIGLRLFVIALQIAGAIAAQSTSLSQIFGNAGVDPMPAIGHLLVIAGLALAVTLGLHVKIVTLVLYSYDLLPAGRMPEAADLAHWGTTQVAAAFTLGFAIAAPFVIASTIYNVALGAINRAMPQLMVSFVGAPAITAGGLILLLLSAPLMLHMWHQMLDGFFAAPFRVAP